MYNPPILMMSYTLKGRKMTMKMPLMIFEKAACEAKATIAVSIPAPAVSVNPKRFNPGMKTNTSMVAARNTKKLTAFFKKLNFVGSTFSFCEERRKNRCMVFRNNQEVI